MQPPRQQKILKAKATVKCQQRKTVKIIVITIVILFVMLISWMLQYRFHSGGRLFLFLPIPITHFLIFFLLSRAPL